MSPDEMLKFARENIYILELALNNNEFGYRYCPVEGNLVQTRGEVSFFIHFPVPKGEQSVKIPIKSHGEKDPFLEAALIRPMDLSAIWVEFKGKPHMLFAFSEEKEKRAALMADYLLKDFIECIGIDTVEKLNYVCMRAEQIQNAFLDYYCDGR